MNEQEGGGLLKFIAKFVLRPETYHRPYFLPSLVVLQCRRQIIL